MDQNASTDYYIVASARFVNESLWKRVTGVAILHYSNSKGKAAGPLPEAPNDEFDKTFSMNQARSIRFVQKSQVSSKSGAFSLSYSGVLQDFDFVLFNKNCMICSHKSELVNFENLAFLVFCAI